MRGKALIYLLFVGILILLLPACGGGGGYTSAPALSVAPPPPPPAAAPAVAPGYARGLGMRHNFGMMGDNMNQMYEMMGRVYMSPEHYDYMRGAMGQMGGMMRRMSSPYYNREMEQQHRQQLEQMRNNLTAMKRQGGGGSAAGGGSAIFASNCASCHPKSDNVVNPSLPLQGAPQLASNYDAKESGSPTQ